MSGKLAIALLAATAVVAAAAPAATAAIYMKVDGVSGQVVSPGYEKQIQTSAGEARPTDQLSLNFAKISYLEVKLPDALVTSYQNGGHEG